MIFLRIDKFFYVKYNKSVITLRKDSFMSLFILFCVSLVLVSVYTLLNVYIAKNIYRAISTLFPKTSKKLFNVCYFIASLFFLSYFLFDFFSDSDSYSTIRTALYWVSSVWMGFFVYLLLFYVAKDLLIFLTKLFKIQKNPLSPKQTVLYCILPFVFALTVSVYGIINASDIKTVQHTVKSTQAEDGFKVVLVSDLHLGAVQSESRLPEIVEKINEQSPDLVCIAGDIFNDRYSSLKNPEDAKQQLQKIKASYGVYACLGNHDGGNELNLILNFLKDSNIKLLHEETKTITDKISLVGRTDGSPIGGFGKMKRLKTRNIMDTIPEEKFVIVMDHNPARISEYEDNADLILCGHTHKGQIFPANLITNAMYDIDYGHQKIKNTDVVVTSGAGTWGMPMRIGSNCEIVVITLKN